MPLPRNLFGLLGFASLPHSIASAAFSMHCREASGVHGHPGEDDIAAFDAVLEPEIDCIHANFLGKHINGLLNTGMELRHAKATISAANRVVGVDT